MSPIGGNSTGGSGGSGGSLIPGAYIWSGSYGSGLSDYQSAAHATIDAEGYVYVVGTFAGQIDFGCTPSLAANDAEDIFVVKFDPNGGCKWNVQFGGADNQAARGVALTNQDDSLWVTGYFSGDLHTWSASDSEVFALELLSVDGTLSDALRSEGQGTDIGSDAAVTSNDNLLIAGSFKWSIDFGGGWQTYSAETGGFVTKFTSWGSAEWSRFLTSTTSSVTLSSVAVDSNNAIFVAGRHGGETDFGSPCGAITSQAALDYFVAKYNNYNSCVWVRTIGDAGFGGSLDLAVDGGNNLYVLGDFNAELTFDGTPPQYVANERDIFLVKYDNGGGYQWSYQFGAEEHQWGESIDLDPSGNIALTGRFRGSLDFGCGTLTSEDEVDIFVAKLDPTGGCLWSKHLGGPDSDEGRGVTTDNTGNIVTVGSHASDIDFGSGLEPADGSDAFVVKYGP